MARRGGVGYIFEKEKRKKLRKKKKRDAIQRNTAQLT